MRVLHVITSLAVGGAENMLLRLLSAPALADARHAVVALLPDGGLADEARQRAELVWEMNWLSPLGLVVGSGRLALLARRWRPDVVHGWLYQGNLAGLLAARSAGPSCALVWSVLQGINPSQRTHWLGTLSRRLNRLASKEPDRIVYDAAASRVQHRGAGFADHAAVLMPNGIDLSAFRYNPSTRTEARRQLGLSDEHVAIAMVARFHPAKDHRGLLLAARTVVAQCPQARLVLIGPGVDRSNAELVGVVRELGLDHAVTLVGQCPDVSALLPGMDIYVSSSLAEALSLSIGEAMASELIPVVTDVGDSAALVGGSGIVVPPGQPQRLADALLSAIRMGADERRRRGMAARQRIFDSFALDVVAQRYRALYEEVAARRKPGPTAR